MCVCVCVRSRSKSAVRSSNETVSKIDVKQYLFVCIQLVHKIHWKGSLSFTQNKTFDRGPIFPSRAFYSLPPPPIHLPGLLLLSLFCCFLHTSSLPPSSFPSHLQTLVCVYRRWVGLAPWESCGHSVGVTPDPPCTRPSRDHPHSAPALNPAHREAKEKTWWGWVEGWTVYPCRWMNE